MAGFDEKMEEALIEVGKDTVVNLVSPTAKSIGNNIGLFVDGVMGWLGYWGEKQKIKRIVYLEDYKRKIEENILGIPEVNLIEPSTRIVGPAIEASKYFIEEEYCRDMFAKLIASSCDLSKANSVHPSFPEIIKQLTPLDARFLILFKKNDTYPAVELTEVHDNRTVTPFLHILFDFKDSNAFFTPIEEMNLTKTIESLTRFGLLTKNTAVLELNYDYDSFKEHWLYKNSVQVLRERSTIQMKKYRIELTQLGVDFVRNCVPSEIKVDKT